MNANHERVHLPEKTYVLVSLETVQIWSSRVPSGAECEHGKGVRATTVLMKIGGMKCEEKVLVLS